MKRFLGRALAVLLALYAAGAVLFAFFHYETRRPPVPTILSDYHGWIASGVGAGEAPVALPAPPPAPPPPPPPAPVAPTPPAPLEFDAGDPEAKELRRIEKELLPAITEKARVLRASERGDGIAFDRTRAEAMAALGEARTFLNGILEKDPHHRQANKIWKTLQELYAALKKM